MNMALLEISKGSSLSVQDIANLYRQETPDIPMATIRWRIYAAVKQGILTPIARAKYKVGYIDTFNAPISEKLLGISRILEDKFPYAKICAWDFSIVNSFLQHLINSSTIIVEVPKDVLESIYSLSKDYIENSYFYKRLPDDFLSLKNAVIFIPLITDAPMSKSNSFIYTPTLEKLLVDLTANKEFSFLDGSELKQIYHNAQTKYIINGNRIRRYAKRRNKLKQIEGFLK